MRNKITMPTEQEDRGITAAALADPDNQPLDDTFFKKATRGRPAMLDADKKRRVNLMLDPEVVNRLKQQGNMSAAANKILRETLGL